MKTKIDEETLQRVYDTLKTPYKYGAVVKEAGFLTDSPVVFKEDGKYYMTYVRIDEKMKKGYSTCLAVSNNLVDYELIGEVFTGTSGKTWDSVQSGGYAQLIDVNLGENGINKVNGKYLLAYIGGDKCGYETDPLSMGIALSDDFKNKDAYARFSSPILCGKDEDAREGETLTIYKADMFIDEALTLDHRYVCAYNAKDTTNRESIFLAVSDDGTTWKRYGDKAIINVKESGDNIRINGDPQIIKIGELYAMVYFIYDGKTAYNTFAVSKDLVTWEKWKGKPLIASSEKWDNVFAHKSWVIKENGVVYHYYCAVNDEGERFIALATSEPLRRDK